MSNFSRKPPSKTDRQSQIWGGEVNRELSRAASLADALDSEKIVWLDRDREIYSVATANPTDDITWNTWLEAKIIEATKVRRILINTNIYFSYDMTDTTRNRTYILGVHFPLKTGDKDQQTYLFPPNPTAIVAPAWANNTTGPRACASGYSYKGDPVYVAASANWQGWVDINNNSILNYYIASFHMNDAGGVLADRPFYAAIRIGMMAYVKGE